MTRNLFPVDHLPERRQVITAFVLVFQIVGMFPDIDAEDRSAFHFGYIHQRVILVRGGSDLQLAIPDDQPRPAASKTRQPGGIQLFLQTVDTAESTVDLVQQFAGGRTAFGTQDLPEKAMVPV